MAASDPHCQGGANGIIRRRMSDKDDRAARLAQQLRENLRKRKAQARGQPETPPVAPPPSEDRE